MSRSHYQYIDIFEEKNAPRLFEWQRVRRFVPAREEPQSPWYEPWPGDEEEDQVFAALDAECELESQALALTIERSRRLLALEPDPEEAGQVRLSSETLERAVELLRGYSKSAREELGIPLGIPTISLADCGTIDLFWKSAQRQLLINIPADVSHHATFYGDTAQGDALSGNIASDLMNVLLVSWLAAR